METALRQDYEAGLGAVRLPAAAGLRASPSGSINVRGRASSLIMAHNPNDQGTHIPRLIANASYASLSPPLSNDGVPDDETVSVADTVTSTNPTATHGHDRTHSGSDDQNIKAPTSPTRHARKLSLLKDKTKRHSTLSNALVPNKALVNSSNRAQQSSSALKPMMGAQSRMREANERSRSLPPPRSHTKPAGTSSSKQAMSKSPAPRLDAVKKPRTSVLGSSQQRSTRQLLPLKEVSVGSLPALVAEAHASDTTSATMPSTGQPTNASGGTDPSSVIGGGALNTASGITVSGKPASLLARVPSKRSMSQSKPGSSVLAVDTRTSSQSPSASAGASSKGGASSTVSPKAIEREKLLRKAYGLPMAPIKRR